MNSVIYVISIIIIGVIIYFTGNTRYFLFRLNHFMKKINKYFWDFMFKFNEIINSNPSIMILYLIAIAALSYYMLYLVKMFN